MGSAHLSVLLALSLFGCKRERDSEPQARVPPPSVPADAHAAAAGPTWYRAVIGAADGVDVPFFLGVPAPGTRGQAIFRVGTHEVRSEVTFDGKVLRIPLAVHQTAVEATLGQDGVLRGTFTTSWRAWGASSSPLTATPVAAPSSSALATIAADAAPIDLGAPRTVWKVAMAESGVAKLVVDQAAPGELTGLLMFETGNIVYLAGNGRGDAIVLAGFDGTSGYRLVLALGADRTRAKGMFYGGHRLDWREALTVTRGPDFVLAVKPKPVRPGVKIGLPDRPELAALPHQPMVVELAGSWCSTCRNAAPFLVELYREYQPRGLQMVTLLYEFSDDRAVDAAQAATFKQTYGVTWPVVPVQGDVDAFAEIMPSGLADLNPAGFPITLFLAADRSLVALHAGFPAADATDEFRRVAAEFRASIETLLTSPSKSGR